MVDKNKGANICLIAKHLNIKKLKKKYDEFEEYIYLSCLKALDIAKKYNRERFAVHIYLEGASIFNFSIKFFKKLNKRLLENIGQEEEALDICYIYDPGLLMRTIFKLIKPFLDPVVKQKIVLIKSKNII